MLFVIIKNVLLLQCLYWETHLPRGSHFETGNDVRTDELLAASEHYVHRVRDEEWRGVHLHASCCQEHGVPGVYKSTRPSGRHCWTHWTGVAHDLHVNHCCKMITHTCITGNSWTCIESTEYMLWRHLHLAHVDDQGRQRWSSILNTRRGF